MARKEKAPKRPPSFSGKPYCDEPEAVGLDEHTGMVHSTFTTIERGVYVDVVECDRCKRELRVAAAS